MGISLRWLSRREIFYGMVIFCTIFYFFVTVFAPLANHNFELNQFQIFILRTTIVLLYGCTWMFAAYGILTLERYISESTSEDPIILQLLGSFRNGLFWIISGVILVAIIGGVQQYFVTNTKVLPVFVVMINYLYVFPPFIGFFVMFRGVLRLRSIGKMQHPGRGNLFLSAFIVLLVSCLYGYLVYTNSMRQYSPDPTIPATYYLPDPLIVLTIFIPIVATWWLGFFSAFTLSDLIPHLIVRAGLLHGFTWILYGIWSIIFASIMIQALLSLGGTRLYAVGIGILLVIIYVFILLQGIGYFFIAFGANTLRKTEKESMDS